MPLSLFSPSQSAVDSYAPSSSSSSRSSRSSTRNHSPPPLRSATDKADNLMLQIKHFLDNNSYGSNDLVLSASPVEFAAFQRELHTPGLLHPHQVPDIRYTWNCKTNTLTISCMPGQVHDAIIPFLVFFKEEIPFNSPGMTTAERRALMFFSGTDVGMFRNPTSSIITGHGKHVLGVVKQPDAAFKYIGPSRNGFPRVVFEVAFSQSYESVLEDARQWLVRSKGAVQLCVIVKIYEHPNRNKEIDYDEIKAKLAEQQRITESFPEEELMDTGHDEASSPEASSSTAAISSFSESHNETMGSVAERVLFLQSHDEHAAWVGPLSGFMELYRLSEDETDIVRDGPTYDIFHPTGTDPVLRISDLLPAEAIEGDKDRVYPLPLAEYRRFILMGVEELAMVRKLKQQPANGTGKDPEYLDEGADSDGEENGENPEGGM